MDAFKGLPFYRSCEDRGGFAFTTLFDPKSKECELGRIQVGRIRLVVLWRHEFLLEMSCRKEQEALHWLARNKSRAAVSSDQHLLWRFEVQVALGFLLIMARKAVFAKKGYYLVGKVDFGVPLQFTYW